MTPDRDRDSRLEQAYATLAHLARPTEDCPAPELLWDAARGALPAERARRVGVHVVTCPACIEAWRLARALLSSGAAEADRAATAPSRSRRPLWTALAAAAVLGAVAVGTWAIRSERSAAAPPVYRAPESERIDSALPPGDPLPREHAVLRWTGPAGARYDVEVATRDLTILASVTGLEQAEWRVPPEALAALPAGTPIAWQVRATLPEGRTLRSRTFVTTLQ